MNHLLGLIEMAAGGLSYNTHEVASRINRVGCYVMGMQERPEFETAAEEALEQIEIELRQSADRLSEIREQLAKLPTERRTLNADINLLFQAAAE